MWIKSEEGKLFNVSNAHAIVIEERQNGFVVLAEFNPTDVRSFNLTKRTVQEVALRTLNEIEEAFQNQQAFLNLSLKPTPEVV